MLRKSYWKHAVCSFDVDKHVLCIFDYVLVCDMNPPPNLSFASLGDSKTRIPAFKHATIVLQYVLKLHALRHKAAPPNSRHLKVYSRHCACLNEPQISEL